MITNKTISSYASENTIGDLLCSQVKRQYNGGYTLSELPKDTTRNSLLEQVKKVDAMVQASTAPENFSL